LAEYAGEISVSVFTRQNARALLFAASCLLATTAAEARTVSISVHIVDAKTGSGIGAAAAVLQVVSKDEPVSAVVADKSGFAVLRDVPDGNYRLVVTAPGYDDLIRDVFTGEKSAALNLGRIALSRSAGEIVVTGERVANVSLAPGANSFSVENNALAQSGSLLAAMKSLPGITVEREGKLLLRGSDRVTILIDGKPSALTGIGNQAGLDSIPAANIARIDIINNPSARYGAQGSAGIVNIVTAKAKKLGWSGRVGIKGGFGPLSRRKPDLPTDLGSFIWKPKISPFFNIRYAGGSADYTLQGEMLHQRNLPNNEFSTRFYDDGRIIASQVPENRLQTQYVLKAGTDQRLSDKDTLTVNLNFDVEDHLDRAQVPFIEQRSNTLTRYWFWREDEQTGHASAAVNFRHEFAEAGHNLSLRAEYIRGWEDETYRLNEVSPVRTGTDLTHIIALENTLPISVDYVRPMSKGRIELGGKFQYRWIPVRYLVERGTGSIIYPGLGETSRWAESIWSGYANLVRETPGLTIEAGLRVEHTKVHYDLDPVNIYYPRNDAYSYFRLFPNVRVTKSLGEGTQLSLFFNRRVDRPGEPELRVFPKYDDPELLKVGNPYLRPQFTTAYEISLLQDWGALSGSLALYHRLISDAFQRIYAIDQSNTTYNIVNKIYQNTGNAQNSGVELIANWKASKAIKLNGSFNAYKIKRDAAQVDLLFPYRRSLTLPATSDFTWDGKLSLEAALDSRTVMQVNGIYYAARDIAQGRQSARKTLDLSLARTFGNFKASLSATDIFNSFGTRTFIDGVGFDALYENYYETQAVMLSVEMKF
jgi:outer membrane receptor protein involved in Fe transport